MPPKSLKKSRPSDRSHLLKGSSPTDTKHLVIAEDLRQRVRAGDFVDLIPGQRVLAGDYGVNFLTIRKAIGALVNEGLLVREPGRGTFVTRLKRERTHTLAAVFGSLSYGFGGQHATLLQGLQEEAARHHHDLLLRPHHGDSQLEAQAIEEILLRQKVDGVLLWPTRTAGRSPAIQMLRKANLPVVVMVRVDAEYRDQVSYIVDDDYRGGYLATQHLLELGHRRIGYLARTSIEGAGELFEEERWRGCRQAQIDAGVVPGPRLQADWNLTTGAAQTVSTRLVEALRELTAVFCMNDRLALGILNLQQALGIRVPAKLSIVGYDDMEAADLLGLTTVHQPIHEIGVEAVRVLLAEVERQSSEPQARILEPRLIIRSSTAAPRRGN